MKNPCHNCQQQFSITPEDEAFYVEINVPRPTHCPPCRRQRRVAFRNERSLHHRQCDLCQKDTISCYAANSEFTVYCKDCWWSDKWDPLDYGRDIDFNRPFFEQFQELSSQVPHMALHQEGTSENCQYVNYGFGNKSCYLMLGVNCEDVYFSNPVLFCKSCIDCTRCVQCELCYECVDCTNCYEVFFSQDCINCSESWFLKDCIGSKNCFASTGLRNAEFVFENEQLSETEYQQKMADTQFTPENIQHWIQKRDQLDRTIPKRFMHGFGNENVSGDYIDNCKNLKHCFDCLSQVEDSTYCDTCALNCRKLFDCSYVGDGCELCYESNGAARCHNCQFIYYARGLQDCQYSQYCMESKHLFGCYSLRRKEFCILNKPYNKDKYLELSNQLIEHMKQTQEYGEFFPIGLSAFPYNETVAHEYWPLNREEVLAKGWKWQEQSVIREGGLKSIICQQSKRPFRLIQQEKAFYDQFGLPLPQLHPDIRHLNRLAQRNPRQLWERECAQCTRAIQSSYGPKRPEKILCEECYLKIK